MFVYMHKPMAFFQMVGSECHFFRIFSFSDETISSLTLRWSRSKQEGRHSPAHRRWRALAAKVIQPSPSIRANRAISKRAICNIVSNDTPWVQFVQGYLARLRWAQWVRRLSGQRPCRGYVHCCENMSLACLHSQIALFHECSPPCPAVPFPFPPKREKQPSSGSHPSAQVYSHRLSACVLCSPAMPRLATVFNTGVKEPLVCCEWPDFFWHGWGWDCCRWRLILRSWCVPHLRVAECGHGADKGSDKGYGGTRPGMDGPGRARPRPPGWVVPFISHSLASGQLLLCLRSMTSSPKHDEPSTQRVLSLPLQLLSPLVDTAEEKGYT